MTTVAVIIPYYQKREGILRRALASVLEQKLPPGVLVNVIVADDGSPIPTQREIEGLTFVTPFSLTVIEQPNAGVSVARNICLDNMSPETDYVAFLDSDDIWHPDHLATAVQALDRGYDFYFCDGKRSDCKETLYQETGFLDDLTGHSADLGNGLYEPDKVWFFDKALRWAMFQTSTVAYRHGVMPDLRFETSLRLAGEDCLFFYQLIQKCRGICCLVSSMVTQADGINIFASRIGWNNPDTIALQMGRILAYYRFRDCLVLSKSNRRHLQSRIHKCRTFFTFLAVRAFVKSRAPWTDELCSLIRLDRGFWLWFPLYALYVIVGYPTRLYSPIAK